MPIVLLARRSRSEDRVERRGLQELERFCTPKPESAGAAFLIFFGLPLKSGWLMSRDSGFGYSEGSIYG
jgi:hypothetical protein